MVFSQARFLFSCHPSLLRSCLPQTACPWPPSWAPLLTRSTQQSCLQPALLHSSGSLRWPHFSSLQSQDSLLFCIVLCITLFKALSCIYSLISSSRQSHEVGRTEILISVLTEVRLGECPHGMHPHSFALGLPELLVTTQVQTSTCARF